MKFLLLVTVFMLFLQGCSNRYSENIEEQFINACIGQDATKAYCECVLDVVEERHTQNEYAEIELQIKLSNQIPNTFRETMRVGIEQCKSEL